MNFEISPVVPMPLRIFALPSGAVSSSCARETVRSRFAGTSTSSPASPAIAPWGVATDTLRAATVSYNSRTRVGEARGAVRLSDVASVSHSVQDIRNMGMVNGKPAILVFVFRQPGANIIETVDRVRALLPQLRAEIPPTIDLSVALDRTTTIRASVHEVQFTLVLSIVLVILVVWLAISLIGFIIKGLFWLGVIGLALFAVTSIYGFVKRHRAQ
jgi:multidrug efflux pump